MADEAVMMEDVVDRLRAGLPRWREGNRTNAMPSTQAVNRDLEMQLGCHKSTSLVACSLSDSNDTGMPRRGSGCFHK